MLKQKIFYLIFPRETMILVSKIAIWLDQNSKRNAENYSQFFREKVGINLFEICLKFNTIIAVNNSNFPLGYGPGRASPGLGRYAVLGHHQSARSGRRVEQGASGAANDRWAYEFTFLCIFLYWVRMRKRCLCGAIPLSWYLQTIRNNLVWH